MAETEIELNIDIKKFDLLPRLILVGQSQGHHADMPMCIRPDSTEYSFVILVRFILNSATLIFVSNGNEGGCFPSILLDGSTSVDI